MTDTENSIADLEKGHIVSYHMHIKQSKYVLNKIYRTKEFPICWGYFWVVYLKQHTQLPTGHKSIPNIRTMLYMTSSYENTISYCI